MRPLQQSLHPVITGVLIKEGEIPGLCTHREMTTWQPSRDVPEKPTCKCLISVSQPPELRESHVLLL